MLELNNKIEEFNDQINKRLNNLEQSNIEIKQEMSRLKQSNQQLKQVLSVKMNQVNAKNYQIQGELYGTVKQHRDETGEENLEFKEEFKGNNRVK